MTEENNFSILKHKLENIYFDFENETRNFRLFSLIHQYIKTIIHEPLLKKKIKGLNTTIEKTFSKTPANTKDKKEINKFADIFFNAFDTVGAYFVLLLICEFMEEDKKRKRSIIKEQVNSDFTKRYKKFLGAFIYILQEDLMEYLDEAEFLKIDNKKDKIIFDKEKSVLYFKGKKIKIKRKADFPVEHYILEYLFEMDDKNEEAYFEDIAKNKLAVIDYSNKNGWKKYYRACEKLQDKIRIETGVGDFLILSTGITANVIINKKYRHLLP